MVTRRGFNSALAATLAVPRALAADKAVAPQKVLRYAFPTSETGFDPAQISDL